MKLNISLSNHAKALQHTYISEYTFENNETASLKELKQSI